MQRWYCAGMTHNKQGQVQIDACRRKVLEQLAAKLHVPIHNAELLDRALTHRSYANENRHRQIQHNERLEFLGDAILDLVAGEYLFLNFPNMTEGELTKARASVVCETTLAICSGHIGLGEYVQLGKGEESSGGRTRHSILADTFEALIGAIYIDSGYESAKQFVIHYLSPYLDKVRKGTYGQDYKTLFQEKVQRGGEKHIHYSLVRDEGPDHDKTFYMQLSLNGEILGQGSGKSKKEAEQKAAYEALRKLNLLP